MASYLTRRLALSTVTLLLILAAVYLAIRLVPGGPLWSLEPGSDPMVRAWLTHHHYDDPLPLGFARWLGDVIRLDLGTSLSVRPGSPVSSLIGEALPYSLLLGSLAFGLTLVLALPLGVVAAWRPATVTARAGNWVLYAIHALPAFWIALVLQQVVAARLRWLPVMGPGPTGGAVPGAPLAQWLGPAAFWVLPTVALAAGSLAFVIRYCRDAVLESAASPFIVTARARGASESRVLLRHALSSAAVPLISLFGLMLPGIVSGSILIETIYALPGIGRLFFQAAGRRDYPVLMALSLLLAVVTLAANLAADLLYRVADRRISYGGRRGRDA